MLKTWEQQAENKWSKAVGVWRAILAKEMTSSGIGRQVLSDRRAGRAVTLEDVIKATLGTRSPSTAVLRAQALRRFLSWLEEEKQVDGIEIVEADVFEYTQDLVSRRVAPTGAFFL